MNELISITTIPAYLADSLKWTVTPVVGCSLSTKPSNAIGDIIAFKYTTLPSDNDQFGVKYVKAELSGWNVAESVMVKFYFPKLIYNHPGIGVPVTPNWFYYWGNGYVVPDLVNPLKRIIIYMDTLTTRYGNFALGTGQVYIGPKACTVHYPDSLGPIDGIFYGGPHINGIDCASEVVGHERYHEEIWHAWRDTNGIWFPWFDWKDRDGDMLENEYEAIVCGTDSMRSDTKNMAQWGWNPAFGDYEYMAVVMGDGIKGDSTKDWSAGSYSKQWP